MDNNMSDMINNVKKMVDSGNLPPDIQNLINMSSNTSNNGANSNNTNNQNSNMDFNDMLKNIPPDLMNNLSSVLNSNSSDNSNNSHASTSNDSNNQNNFNIDLNTMLKMKSIIENMNNKNDPRANLLYSLKPYLRDTKKDKLDQYVNLLNMTKVADIMKKENNINKK